MSAACSSQRPFGCIVRTTDEDGGGRDLARGGRPATSAPPAPTRSNRTGPVADRGLWLAVSSLDVSVEAGLRVSAPLPGRQAR